MTGQALVCKLGEHQKIEGADKIVQIDLFGETIITSKDNKEGDVGLLFDCETQLSHEFASHNNMYRHSYLNKDTQVSGYLDDNRRIRPIKLKGVRVSGLWMPINSLSFLTQEKYPEVGTEIDSFSGVSICNKYISPKTKKVKGKEGKVKQNLVPTFKEHFDTDKWDRNRDKAKEGDLVYITEKLHGTSIRVGYLPVKVKFNWLQKFIFKIITPKKINCEEYKFVVGSRRVIKSLSGKEVGKKQNYYKEDIWTQIGNEYFRNKLNKGESIYAEIVGYTPSGDLIMPSASNKKLEKFLDKKEYKEFIRKYGDTTYFRYGCFEMIHNGSETITIKSYKVFVYRITTTNEDGDSIDYSWEQVKRRCEELDVNYVPELWKGFQRHVEKSTSVDKRVNDLINKDSKEFPQHIREGLCIRIENGNNTPTILKSKSFVFKVLENIIKDTDQIDIEESN